VPIHYLVRAADQFLSAEIEQYLGLFNRTFDKNMTADEFSFKFRRQFGDNSYFALMVDDAAGIVGSVGAIEVHYRWRDRSLPFALTVDGMIDERHRGNFLALSRLHNLLTDELVKRGIVFIFTKPNQNSYLYLKKLLGLADIGNLHAYALPLRPLGAVDERLSWLDLPWRAALGAIGIRGAAFTDVSLKEIEPVLPPLAPSSDYAERLRDLDYYRRRYGNADYLCAAAAGKFVIYRAMRYGEYEACFVMEAARLSVSEWFAFACGIKRRHPGVVALLQVDTRRAPAPFVPVPRRLLPDRLNIVGRVLDPSRMPSDIAFAMRLADFEVV
jgi:hypothetical protein